MDKLDAKAEADARTSISSDLIACHRRSFPVISWPHLLTAYTLRASRKRSSETSKARGHFLEIETHFKLPMRFELDAYDAGRVRTTICT